MLHHDKALRRHTSLYIRQFLTGKSIPVLHSNRPVEECLMAITQTEERRNATEGTKSRRMRVITKEDSEFSPAVTGAPYEVCLCYRRAKMLKRINDEIGIRSFTELFL